MASKKKVRYVDGFAIRNIFPDFDVVESHSSSGDWRGDIPTPFIPKGELWIDRRFKGEKDFLIEVHRIEQLKRTWPYRKVRAYLKERLCRQGPAPPFVVRSYRRDGLTVRMVRGEIVRRHLDPCFIFGGHDLVYDYIPAKEVWIDIRQDRREVPYTLFHELRERALMKRGWSYDRAHAKATEEERTRRRKEVAKKYPRPLRMKPFFQTAGHCGPVSLQIVLARFGREYEQEYLAQLCRTSPETGTDHEWLVRAAEYLGASVHASAGGRLSDLRRFVLKERLPVIVGWYSPSKPRKWKFDPSKDEVEDHFSVMYHLSSTHVYLMDPDAETGRRRMSVGRFLKLWWDTDGPDDERVDRWYMVLNFEGRSFE
jgi:hypothetical protein